MGSVGRNYFYLADSHLGRFPNRSLKSIPSVGITCFLYQLAMNELDTDSNDEQQLIMPLH